MMHYLVFGTNNIPINVSAIIGEWYG